MTYLTSPKLNTTASTLAKRLIRIEKDLLMVQTRTYQLIYLSPSNTRIYPISMGAFRVLFSYRERYLILHSCIALWQIVVNTMPSEKTEDTVSPLEQAIGQTPQLTRRTLVLFHMLLE